MNQSSEPFDLENQLQPYSQLEECLICFENGTITNPLVDIQYHYKCGCKATIHSNCLIQWTHSSGKHSCPICRTNSSPFFDNNIHQNLIVNNSTQSNHLTQSNNPQHSNHYNHIRTFNIKVLLSLFIIIGLVILFLLF